MDRGFVRPVVNLVVNRSAGNRDLTLGDIEHCLTGPIIMVVAADRHRNGISTRVGKRRHFGIGLAVIGVDNGVPFLHAGQDEGVFLAVVNHIAARKRKTCARSRGDVGVDLIGARCEVVPRLSTGKRIGNINDMFAGFGAFERAGSGDRNIVAGNNADDRAERNNCVGRAIIFFIGGGGTGDCQLKRGNRRLIARRIVGKLIISCQSTGQSVSDIHVIKSGILFAERAGSSDFNSVAVDNPINRAKANFGFRVAVINLISDGGPGHGDRARLDRSLVGIRFGDQLVIGKQIGVANQFEIDRHGVIADIAAAERTGIIDRYVFAIEDTLDRTEMNRGFGRAVIDLVVDGNITDRDLAFGNGENRLASPVVEVVAADRNRNGIGARIGERRHFGAGQTVVGIDNGITFLRTGQDECVLQAVVNVVTARKREALARSRSNARLHRLADGRKVIDRIVAGERKGNRYVFPFPDQSVGKLAGRCYGNIIVGDNTNDRAGMNDRVCGAVILLVVRFRGIFGDRQLERDDRRLVARGGRVEGIVPRRGAGQSVGDVNIVKPDVLFAKRTGSGDFNSVTIDNPVNRTKRDFGIRIAVVNLIGNGGPSHRDRTRGNIGMESLLLGGKNVVGGIGAGQSVSGRNVLGFANINVGKRTDGYHRHVVGPDDALNCINSDLCGIGAVINLTDCGRGNG